MRETIIKLMEGHNSGDVKLAKVYLLQFYPELREEIKEVAWGGNTVLHLSLDAIEPVLEYKFERDYYGSTWHGLVYSKEEL